jgi:hypothetical protein
VLVGWRDHHDEEHTMSHHDHDDEHDSTSSEGGQVSELAVAGSAPQAVSAGDSVAGQPDQESGEVQEGAQGPNAIPEDETDEHPHRT